MGINKLGRSPWYSEVDNNARYHILRNLEPKISIKFMKIQWLSNGCSLISAKVLFRFKPLYHWPNLELDLRFSSANTLNLEPNSKFGSRGSGSDLGLAEPNFGITMYLK